VLDHNALQVVWREWIGSLFLQIWNPIGTPAAFEKLQKSRKLLMGLAHRKRFELLTPRFVVSSTVLFESGGKSLSIINSPEFAGLF
jgi:hypothetical protein